MSGLWTVAGRLAAVRGNHTATLLANGEVLVAGGSDGTGSVLATAELYDPAVPAWTTTTDMGIARYSQSATVLPDGRVLVAGGANNGWSSYGTAECFNPSSATWTATGNLINPREGHAATLLPNGKVLVEGGQYTSVTASAELFDPGTGTWAPTNPLGTVREFHQATLLANGKVLVTGGYNTSSGPLASAELYDPASGTWVVTGSLSVTRDFHTATLLPNGKVLVAAGSGGNNNSLKYTSAELYDPASGTWTATGSLSTGRGMHTATLLPNGKVLIAGGHPNDNSPSSATASAELYDPASGTWAVTGSLTDAREYHTATLLPNGKVLVAGGNNDTTGTLASTELYDPATGKWTAAGTLQTARTNHSATLLPNGKVLLAGGNDNIGGYFTSAELYDPGLGFSSPAWQPRITTATPVLASGDRLLLTGSLFSGISSASGGNTQDSSTDFPLVQLRRLDSAQVAFLSPDPATGWLATSFVSAPVSGFPSGPALVTVFTNGIPSASTMIVISPSAGTAPASLSYSVNPATYVLNQLITANAPTSSGGAVDTYSISPALPAGLSLNPSTGVISGTPIALASAANYTVTGSNSYGSAVATLNLAVIASVTPPVSSASALSMLTLSSGPLTAAFSSDGTSYFAYGDATTIAATPTVSNPTATVRMRINGGIFGAVTAGSPSSPMSLNPGANLLEIKVTAADGVTTTTYKVIVVSQRPETGLVAMHGDSAPGTGQGIFNAFGNPAISDANHVASQATITGAGVTSANAWGIWAEGPDEVLHPLARTGLSAPGIPSGLFAGFGDPVTNASDYVAFVGALKPGVGAVTAANATGIWAGRAGGLTLVARSGIQAPGCPRGAKFASFGKVVLTAQNSVVFLANLAARSGGVTARNNVGVWSINATGKARLLLRKGNLLRLNGVERTLSSISIFAATQNIGQSRSFNSAGIVAFAAMFADGTRGVFTVSASGAVAPVVSSLSAVPGIGGAKFTSFGSPIVNNLKHVAFRAGVAGSHVKSANNTGIWASKGRSLVLMARTGTVGVPGVVRGAVFNILGDPVSNSADRIAFLGGLKPGIAGVTALNAGGIWANTNAAGTLALIARAQDHAPMCPPGAVFSLFEQVALPETGGVVFLADLAPWAGGVTMANNRGVWSADAAGNVRLVARTGDGLAVDGTVKTIAALTIFAATPEAAGQTRSFNSHRHVAYRADFTDGSQGLFEAVAP